MNNKSKWQITIFFGLIYISLFSYAIISSSAWFNDSIFALLLIILVFYFSKYLKLSNATYIMFNIGLILHNLGIFGYYSIQYGIFGYDNLVHLTNSMVWAYILFNFILKKFQIKENQEIQKISVTKDLKLIFILIISIVSMFGVIVELIEFTGHIYLGKGEGMFYTGVGDTDGQNMNLSLYTDTMGDILVNILGSILGALIYYWKYSKSISVK